MQKQLLIIFLASISLFSTAQKQQKIFYNSDWKVCSKADATYYRLVTLDENGNSIGKAKNYYITGELRGECMMKYPDKRDLDNYINFGPSVAYYKSGKKLFEGNMDNGKKTGQWKSYHENGKVQSEEYYENGKAIGQWKFYFEDGNLESEENYTEGKRTGRWIEYFKNGKLKSEGNYYNDSKTGLWKSYHENGQLYSEGNYENDKPTGLWKIYVHPNGRLSKEQNFSTGQGQWKEYEYFNNGQLKSEASYAMIDKLRKPTGPRKEYFESGQLKSEGNYTNGEKTGYWKLYHKNGKMMIEGDYGQATPINRSIQLKTLHESYIPASFLLTTGKPVIMLFVSGGYGTRYVEQTILPAADQLKKKGIQTVVIEIGSDSKTLREWLDKNNMPFELYFNGSDLLFKHFTKKCPAAIFVNRKGKVVKIDEAEYEMTKNFDENLQLILTQ